MNAEATVVSQKEESLAELDDTTKDPSLTDDVTNKEEAHTAIKISRKVMSSKQWLTIEDWAECTHLLCPLEIKHEGRIECAPSNVIQTIFSSARLGGSVLADGDSQVKF